MLKNTPVTQVNYICWNMLERQFDHRPGCVIVSEYIALLCAIGLQIFSLEPAYQFLLPVFCPYCEAVLLEAVFLIKMMFDVNEARWKVSTFFSICQLCSWYVLFSAPAWDDDPNWCSISWGDPTTNQETIDILCWILVAKRLEDMESYDGVSPPAPRTINCKGKILSILFFVLPKVAWAYLIRITKKKDEWKTRKYISIFLRISSKMF